MTPPAFLNSTVLRDGTVLFGRFPKYRLPWPETSECDRVLASFESSLDELAKGRGRYVAEVEEVYRSVVSFLKARMKSGADVAPVAAELVQLSQSILEVALPMVREINSTVLGYLAHQSIDRIVESITAFYAAGANEGSRQSAVALVSSASSMIRVLDSKSESLKRVVKAVASQRSQFPVLIGRMRKDKTDAHQHVADLGVSLAMPTREIQIGPGNRLNHRKPINILARSLIEYFYSIRQLQPVTDFSPELITELSNEIYQDIQRLPKLVRPKDRRKVTPESRKWANTAKKLIRHCCYKELGDIPEVQDLGKGSRRHSENRDGNPVGVESSQTDGVTKALAAAILRNVNTALRWPQL